MVRGRAIIAVAAALPLVFLLGRPLPARAQTKIRSSQCCPVKIKKSGSYFLTESLKPGTNRDGIDVDVSAPNVTIDLNGFSIIGNGKGSGVGINAAAATSVTVENGGISSMGGTAILLGGQGVARNIQAVGNSAGGGGNGIQCAGSACLVLNCVASSNINGDGLNFSDSTSGYKDNVLNGNGGVTSGVSGGVNMGGNVCNSALCP